MTRSRQTGRKEASREASLETFRQEENELHHRKEWTQLAKLYEKRLLFESDPDAKIGILMRSAQLAADRLGDPDSALVTYRRVLDQHPDHEVARSELRQVLRQNERWEELAGVLSAEVEQHGARKSIDAARELMTVYGEHLGNVERAIRLGFELVASGQHGEEDDALLEKLCLRSKDPNAVARLRDLMSSKPRPGQASETPGSPFDSGVRAKVEEGLVADRRWGDLEGFLTERLKHEGVPVRRAEILVRRAQCRKQHLEELEGARTDARQALQLDPQVPGALELLESLARTKEDYLTLVRTYQELIEVYGRDADRQAELCVRMGECLIVHLDSPEDGCRAMEEAARIASQDAEGRSVIGMLRDRGHWQALATLALQRLASGDDPGDDLEAILEAARHLAKSDRMTRAFALLDALAAHVSDAEGLAGLEGELLEAALEEKPHDETLLARLDANAERTGAWGAAAQSRANAAKTAETPIAAAAHLRRRGEILAAHLDDEDSAAQSYREAASLDPGDLTSHEWLRRHDERRGDWPAVVQTIRQLIASGLGDVTEHYADLARIGECELGDPALAEDAWHKLVALKSRDRATWAGWRRAAERASRQDSVAAALEGLADLETGPPSAELWRRAATMYLGELENTDRGEACLRAALHEDPLDGEAFDGLSSLLESAERFDELAVHLRNGLGLVTHDARRLNLLRRLGRLTRVSLDMPQQALEAWQSVLELAPDDHEALDQVAELGEALGDPSASIVAIEARLVDCDDAAERSVLLRRKGELLQGPLQKIDAAIECFREAVPHDPRAAKHLARLLAERRDWRGVLELYELQLERCGDADDRAAIHKKMAILWESELLEVERAIEQLEAADEERPEDREILESLERLYRAKSDWPRVASTLERRLELGCDGSRAPNSAIELARLHRDRLLDEEAALSKLEEAKKKWPDHLPLLRELRQAYQQRGSWTKTQEILKRELELTRDPVGRREFLGSRAELFEGPLNDPAAAASAYQDILSDLPHDRFALRGIARTARRLEDRQRLSAALTTLSEIEPEAEQRARYARELGDLFQRSKEQQSLAEHWFRRCLEDAPGDPEAVASLAAILRTQDRTTDLIEVYAKQVPLAPSTIAPSWRLEWARLLDREGRQSEASAALAHVVESDPDNISARERAAELFERLGKGEQARALYETGLRLTEPPRWVAQRWQARLARLLLEKGDIEAATRHIRSAGDHPEIDEHLLERLAEAQKSRGDWQDLAETRERQLRCAALPSSRHPLLLELGEILSERLGRPQDGLVLLERARVLDPTDHRVLELLAKCYERCERWDDLAALDRRRTAQASSRTEEVELLLSRGQTLAERVGDAAGAIAVYERALDLDPHSPQILGALSELYRENDRPTDLVRVLEHWLQAEDSACDRYVVYRELAALWNDRFERPSQAIECLRFALAMKPDSVETARDLIVLLGAQGRRIDQIEVLIDQLEKRPESERGVLRADIEAVLKHRLTPGGDRAREVLERLLAVWPDSLPARRKLAALCWRSGENERTETLLESLARSDASPAKRGRHAMLLARLLEDRLHRPHDGVAWLEKAVTWIPSSQWANRLLESAYERWGYWSRLAEHREARLEDLPEESRMSLGLELADIHERYLAAPLSAARVLRWLLDGAESEERGGLIDRLETIYERVGCSEELADLLRGEADERDIDVERLMRSAEELATGLGDVDRAADCLRKVLSIEPDRVAAQERLADLLRRSQRYDELARILEMRLEQDPKGADAPRQHGELGLLYFGPLDRSDEARAHLEAALEAESCDAEVLDALIALAIEEERFEDLDALYTQRIEQAPAGPDRARWIARRARLLADELSRREEALTVLKGAWKHDPACEEARALFRRLTDQGDRLACEVLTGPASKGETAKVISEAPRVEQTEKAAETNDPKRLARELEDLRHELRERQSQLSASDVVRLLARRATLEERIGRADSALLTWLEVLQVHEDHLDGLENVARLYQEGKQPAEALPYLERLVRQLVRRPADSERWIATQRLRAGLLEDNGDWQGAARAYRDALEKQPDAADLLESLASLYVRNGRWIDAEHHLRRLLEVSEHEEQIATTRLLLGQVLLKGLDRPVDAEKYFTQVGDRPRLGYQAQLGLASALEAQERWDDALEVLARLAESATTPRQRTTVRLRRARLLRDRCMRPKEAYEVLREAAGENPGSEQILEEATQTLEGLGDHESLAQLWRSYLDHLPSAQRAKRLDLALKLARLHAEKLGRAGEAAEIYRQALADSDEDPRVTYEFAAVLSRTDSGSREAVRLFRTLLQEDPTRPECLNALETLLNGQGDAEGVLMVQGCRDVLGLLTPRERTRYRANLRAWSVQPFAKNGRFPASLHPKPDAAIGAAAILLQLVPTLAELYPAGSLPKRPVRASDNLPLLTRLEEIAGALRLGSVQLFVAGDDEAPRVHLISDQPLAFGAPMELLRGSGSAETVFLAAKALAGPLGGFGPLLRIGPDKATDALRALGQLEREPSKARRDDRIAPLTQRLRRILPTGLRRSLAALATTVDEKRVAGQVQAFYARLEEAASRYALWMCGDPSGGLRAFAQLSGVDERKGVTAWRESADGCAALRFILSNLHLSLRRQAGVALPRVESEVVTG
ncbi:MAG: hypothetical protein RL885_20545 [Planctomycetota bacterium]